MNKNTLNLMSFTAITGTSVSVFRVLFNLFLREAGYSNSFVGTFTSFSLWGTAIIGLLLGIFADRLGRKKIIVLSTILLPIIGIIMTLDPGKTTMNILSFLRGGFESIGFTVVLAAVTSNTEKESRARAIGLNFGLIMGSGVLGNFVGGLLGDVIGLKWALLASMGVYLLAIIPAMRITETRSELKKTGTFDFSGFTAPQRKVLILFLISTGAVGFGAGLFIHFGNLIFRDLFSMSATGIGIALSFAQLGTAIGSAGSHRLGKKFGPLRFVMIMEILVVPLIVSMAFIRQPVLFTAVYTLRFVFMNITSPILSTITFSILPEDKLSTISGINGFVNNSIRAVAALLFGNIVGSSTSGYMTLFLLSSVFYGISAFTAFLFFRNFERDDETQSLYC